MIEDMPSDTNEITLGVEVLFEIVGSDDPDDVGLVYKSQLTKEEFQEVIDFPRNLNSRELIKIVQRLCDYDGNVSVILNPNVDFVSSRMLKLNEIPSKKIQTVKTDVGANPTRNNGKTSQFNFRKNGDLPIGNRNLSENL